MNVSYCNAFLRTSGLRIDRALVRRTDRWTVSTPDGAAHRASSLGEAFRRARFFAALDPAPRQRYDRRDAARQARFELSAALSF